jgi:DNA-directed RNA polymerase specialized sigma24 family protein
MQALNSGDRQSVEAALEALRPWLLRFLQYRYPSWNRDGDIEDLVQDVLLKLWRRPGHCENAPQAVGYILRVLNNRRKDIIKHRDREVRKAEGFRAKVGPDLEKGSPCIHEEIAYYDFLDRFPVMLKWRVQDELSFCEISRRLGVDEKKARRMFERIAKEVSTYLEGPVA